jgi:feruloyl esterase
VLYVFDFKNQQSAFADRRFGISLCNILNNRQLETLLVRLKCKRIFQIGGRRMRIAGLRKHVCTSRRSRIPSYTLPTHGSERRLKMMRFKKTVPVSLLLMMIGLTIHPTTEQAATTCEGLAKLSLPNTTITMAQTVAAGAFTPPPGGRGGTFNDLPAFCRVLATLKPSSDSDIKMELWLPEAAKWNGKLRGTGNGGLGGGATVNATPLAGGVRLGYATAGNNTGHDGDSSYAMTHPEKIKDFGYRSAHEMTVASKALIKAFYDKPLQYSVMAESGGGTIAALSSAQRYPEDYDMIAVTSMSSYLSRHTFGQCGSGMRHTRMPPVSSTGEIPCDSYCGVECL